MTRCQANRPNSTSHRLRTSQAVSARTVARVHAQALRYTDERIRMVQHDLNRDNRRTHDHEERRSRQKARLVIAIAVITFVVTVAARVLPDVFSLAGIALCEIAHGIVEFRKRL